MYKVNISLVNILAIKKGSPDVENHCVYLISLVLAKSSIEKSMFKCQNLAKTKGSDLSPWLSLSPS